jgi:hypothetical protein
VRLRVAASIVYGGSQLGGVFVEDEPFPVTFFTVGTVL